MSFNAFSVLHTRAGGEDESSSSSVVTPEPGLFPPEASPSNLGGELRLLSLCFSLFSSVFEGIRRESSGARLFELRYMSLLETIVWHRSETEVIRVQALRS